MVVGTVEKDTIWMISGFSCWSYLQERVIISSSLSCCVVLDDGKVTRKHEVPMIFTTFENNLMQTIVLNKVYFSQ